MSSSATNPEKSENIQNSHSTVSIERMPHSLGPNYNAILSATTVRRSPRAPARVKVNFNDVLNGDALKKKRSVPLNNTTSNELPLPAAPGPKKTIGGREIDRYCWLCHKEGEDMFCTQCPRVFHFQCLGPAHRFTEEGVCPECRQVSTDGTDLRDSLTVEKLSKLLPYALNRMVANVPTIKTWKYSEKESKDFICAMDLPTLLQNINERHYKSTVSFLSDVKWILHNCTILHGTTHAVTSSSKNFVKICRTEMLDIEACPDCYQHAYTLDDEKWFSQLCTVNHTLVWAKLKGFPFWPSKAVKVVDGIADVRFFGSHEKGRLPVTQCYRLSVKNPNVRPPKNPNFRKALEELDTYIKNVENKFGSFQYFPPQTVYDPGPENHNTKQPTKKRTDAPHNPLSSKSKKLKPSNTSKTKDNHVTGNDRRFSDVGTREKNSEQLPNGNTSLSNIHSKGRKSRRLSLGNELSKKTRQDHDDEESSDMEVECVNLNKSKSKFMKHLQLNNKNSPEWAIQSNPQILNTTAPVDISHPDTENHSKPTSDQNSANSGNVSNVDLSSDDELTIDLSACDNLPANSSENSDKTANCNSMAVNTSKSSQKENCVEVVDLSEEKTEECNDKDVPCSVQRDEHLNNVAENEVHDTVTSVLDSLEFFEDDETPAAGDTGVLKQEDVFVEDSSAMDIGNNSNLSNDLEHVSGHAAGSETIPSGLNVTEVQVPNNTPQEIPNNENIVIENMGAHQQRIIFGVPVNGEENQQEQMCFVPLPETPTLEKYQNKVYSMMRATVEEIWHDFVNTPNIQRTILSLQKEIEELKRSHQQEMLDISSNTDLIMRDVKSTLEMEKETAVEEMRKKCEIEKQEAINETKKKQWCANCRKEAIFYCCWNTSYCDYDCQAAHWREHMPQCSQTAENEQSAKADTKFEVGKKKMKLSVDRNLLVKQKNKTLQLIKVGIDKGKGIFPNTSAQQPFLIPPQYNYSRLQTPSLQILKSTASSSSTGKLIPSNKVQLFHLTSASKTSTDTPQHASNQPTQPSS